MELFFDHERLEVYQVARELNREVRTILADLPRGSSESAENLGRAARSVTRNIAEGGGKWSPADKANFYHIARGSGTECAASLDELVDYGFLEEKRILRAKELAWRVVSMLVGLIRSLSVTDRRGNSMGASRASKPRGNGASRATHPVEDDVNVNVQREPKR